MITVLNDMWYKQLLFTGNLMALDVWLDTLIISLPYCFREGRSWCTSPESTIFKLNWPCKLK